jgi:integrase
MPRDSSYSRSTNIDPSTPAGLSSALRLGASEFLQAAHGVRLAHSAPQYTLAFHAIELALKAFLARAGLTEREYRSRHKTLGTLGDQITQAVRDRVGIRVTPHQYRHAAAAIIIKNTRDYELARRVLGHKTLRTTTKFYLGLETAHATERFGDIIRAQLSDEALEGVASW